MKSIEQIRADFPLLKREVGGKLLIYLDNGATTQKPQVVIDSLLHYYTYYNANIHRGVHTLSQEATEAYEGARAIVQEFLGAKQSYEVIFTYGTTHGINLVASGFTSLLQKGDKILSLSSEHHSNIVPWQLLCERTGASYVQVPMNEQGEVQMEDIRELLSQGVKLVSVQWVSNALGNVYDVKEIIRLSHQVGAAVLIDAAQAAPHLPIAVQELGADFLVFSGHKLYAPTGIGVLYAKEEWLHRLPPYQGGGDMIKSVSFAQTTYADLPYKFEAGTPHIAGAIALGAAIGYVQEIGIERIAQHEHQLLLLAIQELSQIEGIALYGTTNLSQRAGVVSFNLKGIHPYDVGTILDKLGIAVRTGHHCAQPLMDCFSIAGTVRASFAIYNTPQEVLALVEGVKKAQRMLG